MEATTSVDAFAPELQPSSPTSIAPAADVDPDSERLNEVYANSAPAANMYPESKRLLEIYATLTPQNRSKMLEICETFQIDASLSRPGYYISPYIPPIKKFRFMDLPIELRIQVAKYVLTADKPLSFHWLVHSEDKKLATFKGLEQLTALIRVSKQICAETEDLIWTLNTDLKFDAYAIYRSRLGTCSFQEPKRNWIEEAVAYTAHHMSSRIKNASKIVIGVGCSLLQLKSRPLHACQLIAQMVGLMSKYAQKAKWRIHDTSWTISMVSFTEKYSQIDFLEDFKKDGEGITKALAEVEASGIQRDWRIYPHTWSEDRDEIKQALLAAGLEEAERWMDEGL